MKIKLFFAATLFILCLNGFAQTTNWNRWNWLIGEWQGEGSGQPGQGSGIFSFAFDLGQNVIIRKSHSEYPAANNQPATIHDDLMVIYLDDAAMPTKAIYFDNEGHVINYTISEAEQSIVFTSDKKADTPVFRLSYYLLDSGEINTKFELSRDGENFMTYIEGKSRKIK